MPESCCKLDANGDKVNCVTSNTVDEDKIYTSDCFAAALVFVKGHAVVIGGVAVGIAAIMVSKHEDYAMIKLVFTQPFFFYFADIRHGSIHLPLQID